MPARIEGFAHELDQSGHKRQLFLDLDGVFADFDLGVLRLTGNFPKDQDDDEMWKVLNATPKFYRSLPMMPGADRLYNASKPYHPIFLSGVPDPAEGFMRFAPQDKTWWMHYAMLDSPLITCASRDKAKFCKPGDVLLDDRDHYAQNWRDAGGVFILHNPKDLHRSILLVEEVMIGL